MPPKNKPIAALGTINKKEGAYGARIKYPDAADQRHEFYGPCRDGRARAEADLAQIHAAGAVGKTREQGLEIMAAEARRIQDCQIRGRDPGGRAASPLPGAQGCGGTPKTSFEGVCFNSRHPGPRRVWKGGSEQRPVASIPGHPRHRRECSKSCKFIVRLQQK